MNHIKTAEDEYFRQQEAERRQDEAWERDQHKRAELVESERESALPLWRCPQCRTVLETATLREVEIDRCKSCHGVWLEQGKLERLTQRPGLLSRLFRAFRA